jgi:hypothetical protein
MLVAAFAISVALFARLQIDALPLSRYARNCRRGALATDLTAPRDTRKIDKAVVRRLRLGAAGSCEGRRPRFVSLLFLRRNRERIPITFGRRLNLALVTADIN